MFPRDPADDTPGPRGGETALLPLAQGPCPSCTAFLDQLDGAAEHASQHVNFAVVAKAPLPRVLAFAGERGWRRLRLLLLYAPAAPGQEPRHVGTLEPLWNLFDLIPEGRPLDWVEQFGYAQR